MKPFPVSPFLRTVLYADAGATAVTALAMMFAAPALADVLHLPAKLLLVAGLLLVPYSALVAWLARCERLQGTAVKALIVCNVLWAMDCVILAFSGWVTPSGLGYAFIVAQVVVVVAFAELQYVALRRSIATPATAG